MKKYLLCLFSWMWFDSYGQLPTPQVPAQLSFADIELTIQKAARQEIQQSVDALHRNHTYFQKLLEKTDLHFAVIAPILAAEKIPDDFKYLVIQESSLVGNAVSSSNAVGYWQFKAASATELGLRVDKEVDERMNLYAATKAACAYWKRSNVYFDNWAYTLISYNTGFTGAKSVAKEKYFGKKKMTIGKQTHWYLKKYLAYKVAFEEYVGKNTSPLQRFIRYYHNFPKGKSFKEIAQETATEEKALKEHNHWLKARKIPTDKPYIVLIPVANERYAAVAPKFEKTSLETDTMTQTPASKTYDNESRQQVNGVTVTIAKEGDTPTSLAQQGSITLEAFLLYNELTGASHPIEVGRHYFLEKKKKTTTQAYHIADGTENLWDIAQAYGIRFNQLLKRNRMTYDETLQEGRVVWLRNKRPQKVPIEIIDNP